MLRYLTSGESHGPQLTAVIDGLPAGLKIDLEKLNFQLSRRQKGYGRGGRMKIEKDKVEFVSGLRHGLTLGSPLTMVIKNLDWENWTNIMHPTDPLSDKLHLKEEKLAHETTKPRPGHADLAGGIKYNHKDLRNVLERASARETAARTAVGAVCRQLLESFDIEFASHVIKIGAVKLPDNFDRPELSEVVRITEESEVRCLDSDVESKMIEEIKLAKKERDSLGGTVEIIVGNLPVGLGGFSQPERRLDSLLGAAVMAIPSVKAFEIGIGFKASGIRGSEVHDELFYKEKSNPRKKDFCRSSNNAGGIEGGMTNGENLIIRASAKPIATLNRPLKTVDVVTKEAAEAMVERTDNCIIPALAVVVEASAAIVLADLFLDKFGRDNIDEISRNFKNWLDSTY